MQDKEAHADFHYSYGEKLCKVTFNPGEDPMVASYKQIFAKIIDRLNMLRADETDAEKLRHISIAITKAQEAQMWAVKAVTF